MTLAYTAAEAAAIIGGSCKASWLKRMARDGKFDALKIGGAWHFTEAHIAEIMRLCEVPARQAAKGAAPVRAKRAGTGASDPPPLGAATGVSQLRPRPMRKRGGKPEAT